MADVRPHEGGWAEHPRYSGCHHQMDFPRAASRIVRRPWVIACRDCGVEARFQVPPLLQCADDAPAALLDHVGDGSVGR
jgi:hypothetical protein